MIVVIVVVAVAVIVAVLILFIVARRALGSELPLLDQDVEARVHRHRVERARHLHEFRVAVHRDAQRLLREFEEEQ